MPDAPRVFISYSHDDAAHEDSVLALADRLRDRGIDVIIDRFEPVPQVRWPLWCEKQIEDGVLDEQKKALAERVLNAEMDHHLKAGQDSGNRRNGYGRKTVLTGTGKIDLAVPRDRLSSSDPQLIAT